MFNTHMVVTSRNSWEAGGNFASLPVASLGGRGGPPRVTPSRGWHPSEINKSESDEQKRSSVFQEKINRGDTGELGDGDD